MLAFDLQIFPQNFPKTLPQNCIEKVRFKLRLPSTLSLDHRYIYPSFFAIYAPAVFASQAPVPDTDVQTENVGAVPSGQVMPHRFLAFLNVVVMELAETLSPRTACDVVCRKCTGNGG